MYCVDIKDNPDKRKFSQRPLIIYRVISFLLFYLYIFLSHLGSILVRRYIEKNLDKADKIE